MTTASNEARGASCATAKSEGCHASSDWKNQKYTMLRIATKPPAFDATDRNAVTGVGDPSYVSGAQKWNGTALTLNANPTRVRKSATANSGGASPLPANLPISESSTSPPLMP